MHPRAQQLIEKLQLVPHPEGGYYREVYRSPLPVHSERVGAVRAALTDIYFLLPAGQVSRWHRVAHDELWNFYAGAPLALLQLSADLQRLHRHQLDGATGNYKQLIPGGSWQAAESAGEYTLVGCSVAPGFDFSDFRLLRELPESAARIHAEYPDLVRLL